MRDVELVDYSRPGFVVVYVEGVDSAEGSDALLTIRDGAIGPRLEPTHAALSATGTLTLHNDDERPHLVSCPAADTVFSLAPGETRKIELTRSGEYPLFLIDVPGVSSLVFVAPGTYSVVSASGRFELADLPPGRHRLGAWHPRLPSAFRWIDLDADGVLRVDVEVGVDVGPKGASNAL